MVCQPRVSSLHCKSWRCRGKWHVQLPQRLTNMYHQLNNTDKVPAKSHRNPSSGFTLIELLLSAVLGALIIAALGSSLLVSQVRLTKRFEDDQNLKDSFNRISLLMDREIALASDLTTPSTDPTSCGLTDPLVIVGPRKLWRIVYGFPTPNPQSGWHGPSTLMRCGPSYNTSGSLNISSTNVTAVVLDRLSASIPWDPIVNEASIPGNTLSRGVKITMTFQNSNGSTFTQAFGARSAINPYYSLGDQVENGGTLLTTSKITCTDTTTPTNCYKSTTSKQVVVNGSVVTDTDVRQHFNVARDAGAVSIVGSTLGEDIVYLPRLKSEYTFKDKSAGTGICDRKNCYLTSTGSGTGEQVTIQYANVLVFPDAVLGI